MAQGPGVPPLITSPGLAGLHRIAVRVVASQPFGHRGRKARAPRSALREHVDRRLCAARRRQDAIAAQAERTRTPWIGEHLAFIPADPLPGGALHDPTTLTYTVCPQLSEEVLDHACANISRLQERFTVPLIVENSPQYFAIPGSTMSIVDFVAEFHRRTDAGMLLDLTHFRISAMNMNFETRREILRLPLEKVVEVHVSGLDVQAETAWDDPGLADEETFELLALVLRRTRPRAITFEYNWPPDSSTTSLSTRSAASDPCASMLRKNETAARHVHAVLAAAVDNPLLLERLRRQTANRRKDGAAAFDLERIRLFAGLAVKVRQNDVRLSLPLTFKLLDKLKISVVLFAAYGKQAAALRQAKGKRSPTRWSRFRASWRTGWMQATRSTRWCAISCITSALFSP